MTEENEKGWLSEATLDCQGLSLAGGSDGIRTRDLSLDRAAC
jgi:hypothetical protein